MVKCAFHQVFIKGTKDQLEDVDPLVLKVAGRSVPLAIGGMQDNFKFMVNQLRDSQEFGG